MNLVRVLRLLITAEIAFVLIGVVAGVLLRDTLPALLQQYLALEADRAWSGLDFLKSVSYLVAFGLLIAGWIGLWKLKPWSRLVYTAAWILSVLVLPMVGPAVLHGVEYMLGDIATLAAGMTLALIWLSPLAVHFSPKPPDSSAQDC